MEDDLRGWWQGLAVRGVLWRRGLDWAIANVPFYFHPFLICFWTIFFFFFAGPARRTVVSNLAVVLPGSWRVTNYFRAFRTFYNFAWTIAEGTTYKLNKAHFSYELSGANFLDDLLAAKGAIILTAHMGSYDLGAALFTEKFQRAIRMIRAPEPDKRSAQHIDLALEQAGAGAVKVDYNTEGASLSFDLLNALRNGEIVSIQGDRVMDNVASSPAELFGRKSFPAERAIHSFSGRAGANLSALCRSPGLPSIPDHRARADCLRAHEPPAGRRSRRGNDSLVASARKRDHGTLEPVVCVRADLLGYENRKRECFR